MTKNKDLIFKGDRVALNDSTPWVTYQVHIQRYIFASTLIQKNMKVLDVACGSGYGSNYLVDCCKEIIGLDSSKTAIDYCNTKFKQNNLSFREGDATKMPFENNTFDAIVSFMTIEHIKDFEKFLFECNRTLKEGGIFICATDNKNFTSPFTSHPLNPHHTKEFYPEEFYNFLSLYFKKIKFYGQANHSLGIRKLRYWKNKFISKFSLLISIDKSIQTFLARNHIREEEIANAVLDKRYSVTHFEKRKHRRVMIAVCVKKEI